MRSCKLLFILMNFLVAKDVTYKIHTISTQDQQNLITLNGVIANDDDLHHNSRTTRDDTSTIWLQDFEGDLSDWTTEEGWELKHIGILPESNQKEIVISQKSLQG